MIDQHARHAGVDRPALYTTLANGTATRAVTAAETSGRPLGVDGTPARWIDDQPVIGLRSPASFERLAENPVRTRR